MKLAIAGDAAGQPLVRALMDRFAGQPGLETRDMSEAAAGELYAQLSERVASALLAGTIDRAVLICGTGIGVCISANKVPGIRAALCHDTYSAERAALSNNARILTMGARVIGPELAAAIVAAWLPLRFDPQGRSAANVAAIDALEAKYTT